MQEDGYREEVIRAPSTLSASLSGGREVTLSKVEALSTHHRAAKPARWFLNGSVRQAVKE
jgi:hypothetical protein